MREKKNIGYEAPGRLGLNRSGVWGQARPAESTADVNHSTGPNRQQCLKACGGVGDEIREPVGAGVDNNNGDLSISHR